MTHAIVNTKHKSIVVPTSEAIANLFPDAPRIDLGGQAMMVVPYRPTEAFILRQFGYEVDAPIMHLYDWAGGKPFDIATPWFDQLLKGIGQPMGKKQVTGH